MSVNHNFTEAGVPGVIGGVFASIQGVALIDAATAVQYSVNIGMGYLVTVFLKLAVDAIRGFLLRRRSTNDGKEDQE